jgi:hypothetical protein
MERRLRAGQLKITGFFDEVRVLKLPDETIARFGSPELMFMNLNTPADVGHARALWSDRTPATGGTRG